jgi:hypothetical protein
MGRLVDAGAECSNGDNRHGVAVVANQVYHAVANRKVSRLKA